MSWRVELADAARRDIESVLEHTLRNFGQHQFDAYEGLIRSALADIAADPRDFRSEARPEIDMETRFMHIGRRGRRARHLFVYRIVSDRAIRVDRLLHDAMDVQTQMSVGAEPPPNAR